MLFINFRPHDFLVPSWQEVHLVENLHLVQYLCLSGILKVDYERPFFYRKKSSDWKLEISYSLNLLNLLFALEYLQ